MKNKETIFNLIMALILVVIAVSLVLIVNFLWEARESNSICQLIDNTQYGWDIKTGSKVDKRQYIPCKDFTLHTPYLGWR